MFFRLLEAVAADFCECQHHCYVSDPVAFRPEKNMCSFYCLGPSRSRAGTTETAPAAATVRSEGWTNSGPNLHVTLLLGVRFSDHSGMNSHPFLPFPVEYVLRACDREEATVRVRPTRDPPVKSKNTLDWSQLVRHRGLHLLFLADPIWVFCLTPAPFYNTAGAPSAWSPWDGPEGTFDKHIWLASKGSQFHFWKRPEILGCQQRRSHEARYVLCL